MGDRNLGGVAGWVRAPYSKAPERVWWSVLRTRASGARSNAGWIRLRHALLVSMLGAIRGMRGFCMDSW